MAIAGELVARDRELAIALSDAGARLRTASEQLTAGLSAKTLQAIYGPMGADVGLAGRKPAVLEDEQPIAALERVADEVRGAFAAYQQRGDERRMVASTSATRARG